MFFIIVPAFVVSGIVTEYSSGWKIGLSSFMSFSVIVMGKLSMLVGVLVPVVTN